MPSKRTVVPLLSLTLLTTLAASPVAAKAPADLLPLRPVHAAVPPKIDGILDDAVWEQAPRESDFKTWNPDYGKDMTAGTVVYYAYDRENLYFAFRCSDPEPAKIKAAVSGRDTINADDWVCINLDTFNDHQSLYALYVNPLGIQADSRFEGNQEDYNVDIVWFSSGRIDADGYAIEIRLPLKSLRYRSREPVTMGVIFERRISRLSEGGTFPPLDPAQGPNFLTQTRPLLFEGIAHNTLLELLPAVTYGRTSALEEGVLKAGRGRSDLSLTGKYGLTSQLILDGTFNPDFSQIESDAGQVDFNQRYALFYDEKRPFFLEGQEKFNFPAGADGPLGEVVHTRTIIDPRVGFKLNGKLGPRDSIASIYAMDELPGGGPEDFAHFTILRYKRALSVDSYVGGFLTGRFAGAASNVVAGADGQLRLNQASTIGFHVFGSGTKAGDGSAARDGHAVGLQYDYQTRDLIIQGQAQDLGTDFATDVGYVSRTGLTRLKLGLLPMFYPKSKVLLRVEPMLHSIQIRDKWSGLWETANSLDLRLRLVRNTTLSAGARYSNEIFLGQRFPTSILKLFAATLFSKQVAFQASWTSGQKIRYVDDPYKGRGTEALAAMDYLPSENIALSFSLRYSDFTRASDGVREFDYTIVRGRATYQVNKYLFFRVIVEHNSFRKRLTSDLLASFTYIPGTVVHIGYGSAYERIAWQDGDYVGADRFLEARRGVFFKASYLWRL
jgi:Domain of unknown function (DUF5916)/Carbohydrate family 9 binding domain-like